MLTALLLLGCVHRVEVTTVPTGANLYRAGAHVGEAPGTVAIRPFASTRIEARLPGYRTATTSLRGVGTFSFLAELITLRWGRALGLRPRAAVEIRLMPEHGPAGTWAPEDVP